MTQSESHIGECIYIRLGMGPPADPSDSSILSTKVGAPEQGRPCLLSSWLRRKVGRFARAAALERRGRRPQLECRLCASISLYDHCERVRAEQKRKLRTSSTSWTSDSRRCSAAQAKAMSTTIEGADVYALGRLRLRLRLKIDFGRKREL